MSTSSNIVPETISKKHARTCELTWQQKSVCWWSAICWEIQYMTHLMCVLTIYYSQNVKLESNVDKPFKTPLRTKV